MDWIFRLRWFLALFPLIFLLLACTPTAPAAPEPVSPLNLTAYATETDTVKPTPTLPATAIPIPTPTPFTYSIAKGDTLSGLAQRFGITLDELLAANPGIQAEALSVGQTIQVPSASQSTQAEALPELLAVDLGPVDCFPTGVETLCLASVHNPYEDTLENVRVQVMFFDAEGQPTGSQEALLPLDILPAGQTLPAAVRLEGSNPPFSDAAQLAGAIRLLAGDTRYLPAKAQNLLVKVDWDGRTANVSGQVYLSTDSAPATSLWLAGVAYDRTDRIVGFRRWEWSGSLAPSSSQPFAFSVYSLGPVIDRVEVIVEARP